MALRDRRGERRSFADDSLREPDLGDKAYEVTVRATEVDDGDNATT